MSLSDLINLINLSDWDEGYFLLFLIAVCVFLLNLFKWITKLSLSSGKNISENSSREKIQLSQGKVHNSKVELTFEEKIAPAKIKTENDYPVIKNYNPIKYSSEFLEGSSDSYKKISDLSVTNEFANQGFIKEYRYFAVYDYYPLRYTNVPSEVYENRLKVWSFKDGKNTEKVAKEIANALQSQLLTQHLLDSETVFVIIPASTKAKTTIRFYKFCSLVCKYTGLSNGYGAISILYDREPLKGTVGLSKIDNLLFEKSFIYNKKVVLFDDVKTTGSSFSQVADRLSSLGATEVIGCFLATTYNSFKNGLPYWEID